MSATLVAEKRERLGSRFARRLRAAGRIPVSIQGGEAEHVDCSIASAEFWTARRAHEHLFDFEGLGGDETAVVRELQWDAFGDKIIHVEFMRVVRGVAMESEAALEFTGHPKGGVLNHLVTHVTVSSIPSMIPDQIEVSVDGLEEGDHITAGDLVLPTAVELVTPSETQIATITTARADVVAETEEEGESELGAELPDESAPGD